MDQVTVTLAGTPLSVPMGERLSACLPIRLPCGGHGKCGKCKVKASGALSEPTETERAHLTEEEIESGIRLACLTYVQGDCTVSPLSPKSADLSVLLTEGALPPDSGNPMFSRFGVAIDIGTTTLAAALYDPTGRTLAQVGTENPQSTFGADVISRMEAALRGEGSALATALRTALDGILTQLGEQAGITPTEIDALVLTGNTVMLHLLTETDVEPLTHAPFTPSRLFGETCTAQSLGLQTLLPQTKVLLPPCISAFVGADTVCALLASRLCENDQTTLLADIGTNGEIALWHAGRLSVCSTAAGPAFEGVGISMGMRGAIGAIDRVQIRNGELTAHVIGDTAPIGICGSGLIDAVACLLESCILEESGYMENDSVPIAPPVVLTDRDIRMVQLAKSAICAGIETLLTEARIPPSAVEALFLAGGFGKWLSPQSAAAIGLIPPMLADKITPIGNASLSGASMLLLDRTRHADCIAIASRAKPIELSGNPVFTRLFTEGMLFP